MTMRLCRRLTRLCFFTITASLLALLPLTVVHFDLLGLQSTGLSDANPSEQWSVVPLQTSAIFENNLSSTNAQPLTLKGLNARPLRFHAGSGFAESAPGDHQVDSKITEQTDVNSDVLGPGKTQANGVFPLGVGPLAWLGALWTQWQAQWALDAEEVDAFLAGYTAYCERELRSAGGAVDGGAGEQTKLCDCVPATLVGRMDSLSSLAPPPPSVLPLTPSGRPGGVGPGGQWSPWGCRARQRVAVIVPYRDREGHLAILLSVLHPMLQRQQLDYTVFVVEQTAPELFNKAMLMNAGFTEARRYAQFDCYLFHDVDMIPEDDRNFYTCARSDPRHVGSHLAQYRYKLIYTDIFGGVTAFTEEQFEGVNGFSNSFYGWGGEDDDMHERVRARGLSVTRFPRCVARYHMIDHQGDQRNPRNAHASIGHFARKAHYLGDGLTTLNYTLRGVEHLPLYTHLLVALPPPPTHFRTYDRAREGPYVTLLNLGALFVCLYAVIAWDHARRQRSAGR